MTALGNSDLDVFPLNLGGNVFGWTADREVSFAVLDAYAAAGGNFVDTADTYSSWVPGNSGGESESILGEWFASRGNRDQIVVATKVAKLPDLRGLSAPTIAKAAEASLQRLGTDHIDLYYAHQDDPSVPLEETLGAFDALVKAGKVRWIAASNFTGARLQESLDVSRREGFAPYVAAQNHYNLVERAEHERDLTPVLIENGLSALPYYGLARGFLTGKYRPGSDAVDSPRAGPAARHLATPRGLAVLAALDEVAESSATTLAAVALAWLAAQPTVIAPVASARTPEQLADLLPVAELQLTAEQLQRLTDASA